MVREDKSKIGFQDGSCGSHKSFCCHNVNFNLNRPKVQEQTSKIDFQDGGSGGHFGLPITMILAIFISTGRPVDPS